ncbi:MAG: hypothetical protein FJ125_09095, partial [Deltaproteobacteria bacterium]|nr:hypothetical protein [Deltaproteobacteria bacterium]
GAMSVVYRVSRNGQQLALKILALDAATQAVDVHLQFRREVAAIARLDHPVLVRVLEAGDHDGRPYLVMELAEGEALDRRIARQRLLDDDETLALGRAIGEALAEIHRFGLIHRDIKPANIMLGESGRVRLIDLGLVTGAIEDDIVAGTLHYASPEQVGVIKCAVGAPADLYALGATLFECLTGHPPFVTDSQADFLHQLATVPAPDLLAVRPATRPGLAAVIARLLAKDPDDRYQTARGLLHDLTQLEAIEEALRQGQPAPLASRDVAISTDPMTPLVGRSEELEQLSRSWQRARQGMAAFVRIEGESGCGKTRLASELIARAEAEGALVLSGKCQELEAVPFGPLREAVEQLAARIQRMAEPKRSELTERIRDAADESAPLVKRLSLGISRLIGDTRELRTLDPDAEQQRYYEALASFFRSLGTETSPLLLLVDDVQWLDEGSLRVLARIAADGSPGCLLVLATARSAVEYAAPRERFAEAIKAASSERLDLCPLSVAAVGELIEAHLGSKGLDGPVVDKLAALTRGNPLAVCEYLRALLDAGVVRPVAGRWHTDPAAIEAIDLPRDVVELVLRRLDALGSEAARLLAIAGILGGRFSTELLGRISGMAPEVQARGLEELVRVAIVERSYADSYVFLHDRVREAAVERLAEEERRTIHQAIAAALEALPELSPADIYALARHHAEGRPEANPRRVAETSLAAGLLALEEHASEEAFGLLDRALVHARRGGCYDELAPRLLEGLGRACAMTGRLQRAFEHLEEALARAGSKRDRFRLQHLLTLTFASQGRNDEALAALHEAFALLGRPYPRTLVLQALTLVAIWLLAVFLRWTGLGRGRARGAEQERRRVLSQLHYAGSMIALFQGRPFLMVQFI